MKALGCNECMGSLGRVQLVISLLLAYQVRQMSAQVRLPGCQATSTAGRSPNRDYSGPASRLVGRWTSTNPLSAAVACQYFGPIDKETGTGLYVSYSLQALDKKTGVRSTLIPGTGVPPSTVIWGQVEGRYRVVNEVQDGDSVTVSLFLTNGTAAHPEVTLWTETHYVTCDGSSDSLVENIKPFTRYVDDKNLACSQGDSNWESMFSWFLTTKPPAPQLRHQLANGSVRQVRYSVEGIGEASLTYRNASGGTDQVKVFLPWAMTFDGQAKQFVYLSAQKQSEFGDEIKCTIYLDDVPVQKAASNSPYGIATVSGTIPLAR